MDPNRTLTLQIVTILSRTFSYRKGCSDGATEKPLIRTTPHCRILLQKPLELPVAKKYRLSTKGQVSLCNLFLHALYRIVWLCISILQEVLYRKNTGELQKTTEKNPCAVQRTSFVRARRRLLVVRYYYRTTQLHTRHSNPHAGTHTNHTCTRELLINFSNTTTITTNSYYHYTKRTPTYRLKTTHHATHACIPNWANFLLCNDEG